MAREKNRGSLPREAVEFVRKLIEAGVSPQMFARLAADPNVSHLKKVLATGSWKFARCLIDAGVSEGMFEHFVYDAEYARLELSLILGMIARIVPRENMLSSYFTPLALNLELDADKASSHYAFEFHGQFHHGSPASAPMLSQLQPAQKKTKACVFITNRVETGEKILQHITRYAYKQTGTTQKDAESLRENRFVLGLGHARKVADMFLVQAHACINRVIPVRGPGSVGRSMFILVDYVDFSGFHDTEGKAALAWYEIVVVSEEGSRGNERVVTRVHQNLRSVIPQGALLCVANTPWFEEK